MTSSFCEWLRGELLSLNADVDVFEPYIVSILSEEEDDEEVKAEAIDGIIAGIRDDEAFIKKFRYCLCQSWSGDKWHLV